MTSLDIILIVVSLLIGRFWDLIERKIRNGLRHIRVVRWVKKIGFEPEQGLKYFDHAIPFYEKRNLKVELSESNLIIEIPTKYKSFFAESDFEFRQECTDEWDKTLSVSFNHLGIGDYQSVIEECAHEVAEQIQNDIRQGLQRFNGEMLGIKQINLQRIGKNENSSLRLNFYKTDFFTFRVFARIYKLHKDKFQVTGVQDLNNYYTPFLSSFGVSHYLIVDDGYADRVLFGYRSNNVAVDKNKIHFSMNEAFTLEDLDGVENYTKLSLNSCLKRGLREELGITGDIFDSNIEKHGFLDLLMDTNRFEIGLSSFSRLKLDENFTMLDFERAYQSAQDSDFETDKVELVKVSEINKFIKKNHSKMSVGSRNVIQTLKARHKAGYLR